MFPFLVIFNQLRLVHGRVGLIGIDEKCLPNLNSVKNHVRFESQNIRLLFLRIHRPQNALLNFFQPRDGINGISKKPLCQLRIFPQKLQFSISHWFLKRKKNSNARLSFHLKEGDIDAHKNF